MDERNHGLKAPVYASLSLAMASFGDAFLYVFLPLNHKVAGIPVECIGILLSVNRFARILSNTWMVKLVATYGIRVVTIAAVLAAIITTGGYAVATSISIWILLRVLWGLAFSALRISTLAYSLGQSRQGFALGLAKGIQETGPLLALLCTPILLVHFSWKNTLVLLTTLSLPALYFAWLLPAGGEKTAGGSGGLYLQFPSGINLITLAAAFVVDGIIVVTLGVLFLYFRNDVSLITATALAAFYLGYRRICLMLLSPVGGWLADRVGAGTIFHWSLVMMVAGLLLLMSGIIEAGAIITFAFYSIHLAVTPGHAASRRSDALNVMAENATWRDLGAAAGTIAGGLLLTSQYLKSTLLFLSLSCVSYSYSGINVVDLRIHALW